MENNSKRGDCSRGCSVMRDPQGELQCTMDYSCCKLASFDWLEGYQSDNVDRIYEVRFKNTHKGFFINATGSPLAVGDIVAVEVTTGHDVGIVSMKGAEVIRQMIRRRINPESSELKKIYRKAKILDLEKWQEAIAREHRVMIRSRQIAADEGLQMKIGDVEFQGDGTKAIFYYIADERVDFRRLIKLFASEFGIRIEMRQFGARQEAGLIGGLGVCGRELCCSQWMSDFSSITTQAARVQDLSLNPQKLAGQCSKLKCCINHEAAIYVDAQKSLPRVTQPLETVDGPAYLVKTDVLKGLLWFSYDPHSIANIFPFTGKQVEAFIEANKKGEKIPSLVPPQKDKPEGPSFKSAAGEDSITRFDRSGGRRDNRNRNNHKKGRRPNNAPKPA